MYESVLPSKRQRMTVSAAGIVVELLLASIALLLWLNVQQGLVSEEARRIAEDAGLAVIMDRCLKVDYRNLATTSESS